MSFTDLLTSIDNDASQTNHALNNEPVQASHGNPSTRIVWTKDMERKLLDLLHEQVQLGRKVEGGFKKEAWTAIEKRFKEEVKINLSKENCKNKLKTWKMDYRMMKELKNTSGFEWNEATQCVDADEKVWEDILKRKDFKNAKVFKRRPFYYFDELSIIVGNDIAEGNAAATPVELQEGIFLNDTLAPDYEEDISTPFESAADLNDDDSPAHVPTQPTTSGSGSRSSMASKRPKRKRSSMAGSLDAICETIGKMGDSMRETQNMKMDASEVNSVYEQVHAALQAIPGLSEATLVDAYDTFLVEPARAKGFLIMTESQRVTYIERKFGSL